MTLSPSFRPGVPKQLFQAPISSIGGTVVQNRWDLTRWDLTADGQRFLINTSSGEGSAPMTVVLNWQDGLKK